jgi:hypothetical protein
MPVRGRDIFFLAGVVVCGRHCVRGGDGGVRVEGGVVFILALAAQAEECEGGDDEKEWYADAKTDGEAYGSRCFARG